MARFNKVAAKRKIKPRGRMVRHKPVEAQFEERLRFERLLTDISTKFISMSADHIDYEIQSAQKEICECLGLDMCTLWQFSPDSPENLKLTHVHVPPDFPVKVSLAMDAKKNFPWVFEKMKKKEIIVLSRITDAPAAAARDLESWRHFSIKSFVTCPLYAGDGVVFGAINFNAIKERRDWSEQLINKLQIVTLIFANALNRKFTEESLRESEARFKLAVDSANAGLWSWDYKTNIIWATKKARSLYGFSSDEELTAQKFFNRLHPDDLERLICIVEEAFRSGGVVQIDYRIVLPDKSVKWILARAQAFLKPAGEPDRMMGVSFDITQRKEGEMETARLRFELWHLSRAMAMNELSTSLAHEINQPLGAILNNASAAKLLMAQDKHDEIEDILADIIKDSKRAGDVIRKIWGLVKKGNVQFEPLALNPLIEDVVALFQGSINIKKVSLLLELKPDLSKVRGDYVHLQQVLLNLFSNALEAMKESPVKRLMIRSAMSDAEWVTVSISDSGTGISDARKDKVFEPFFTTKRDGLGMGLPICRSIIEDHGGKIWADNNPDGGAIFSFSLKALKGESG